MSAISVDSGNAAAATTEPNLENETIVVREYSAKDHARVFELCEEMAYGTDTYGQSWSCNSSRLIRMTLLALLIYLRFHWSVWIVGGLFYETLIIAYTYVAFNWGYARSVVAQAVKRLPRKPWIGGSSPGCCYRDLKGLPDRSFTWH